MKAKMNVLYTETKQYPEKVVISARNYERWPYADCRLVVFIDPNDPSDRTAVFDVTAGAILSAFRDVPQMTIRDLWDARGDGNSDAALIRRAIAEFDSWCAMLDLDALVSPKGDDNE